jgi:16S rRNA (uracil1498-N3)-methyltransferase
MRANYKLQRLYVDCHLEAGLVAPLNEAQAHYLGTVLRYADGTEVLAFNGTEGEWRCVFRKSGKKSAYLVPSALEREQMPLGPVNVMFAPLKVGRVDFLVQRLVEMGAATITPVLTEFTQNRSLSTDKVRSWVIEAAEQCGVIALPKVHPVQKLADAIAAMRPEQRLIFCDEASGTQNPLAILRELQPQPISVLVGPEGGFSDAERAMLRALPNVTAIPLGPRILRADTAAVAAMAVVQAAIGDWRD